MNDVFEEGVQLNHQEELPLLKLVVDEAVIHLDVLALELLEEPLEVL